jgi:Prokaryotic E2 family E
MLDRRKKELELVEAQFGELETAPDLSWFVVRRFPLAAGWNKKETALLVLLPPGYPETPPDNFHTDADFALANGAEPDSASGVLDHAGRSWRVFSWHFEDASEWQPDAEVEQGHNLLTFLLGVQQRVAEAS